MNKNELTEADIRTEFITPLLGADNSKWDSMTQIHEEFYRTLPGCPVRVAAPAIPPHPIRGLGLGSN